MVLSVSTIERNKIELGIFDNKSHRCFEFETGGQSEDLLVAIEGILKKNKLVLKDLRAVLINRGPGSFTGTRVGVTVANTLGWNLNIPVIGYRNGELEKTLGRKIYQSKFSKPVIPYY